MNLRIFFDPIRENEVVRYEPNALVSLIDRNMENFPKWQQSSIAIIGIQEDRGTENKNISDAADKIRFRLYQLQKGVCTKTIADLGNLRLGIDLNESRKRLKEVCEILLDQQVFPLIIGGGHDMDYGQFLGYESSGKLINVLSLDATIDMFGSDEFGENRHHLHRMLVHEPPLLFHYAHLAYQSFLIDPQVVSILEKLHFETYRLGHIREKIEEMEPVIRNADMLTFDLSAVKRVDAPGNCYAQPFGLTGEEACQICWYAGLSPRLTSAGFYEFNPLLDEKEQTAAVIATMIWYFLEGFELRKKATKITDQDLTKYIVSLPEEPHKLTFYKDTRTEKWWIEIPQADDKPKYANVTILPCSYSDYLLATKGEIPIRWILTQAKIQ